MKRGVNKTFRSVERRSRRIREKWSRMSTGDMLNSVPIVEEVDAPAHRAIDNERYFDLINERIEKLRASNQETTADNIRLRLIAATAIPNSGLRNKSLEILARNMGVLKHEN